MGDVTLTIAAEKFQQPATDKGQLEDNLSARISSIRYYLYKDNTLVQSGIIDNATDLDTDTHPLLNDLALPWTSSLLPYVRLPGV